MIHALRQLEQCIIFDNNGRVIRFNRFMCRSGESVDQLAEIAGHGHSFRKGVGDKVFGVSRGRPQG